MDLNKIRNMSDKELESYLRGLTSKKIYNSQLFKPRSNIVTFSTKSLAIIIQNMQKHKQLMPNIKLNIITMFLFITLNPFHLF